MGPWWGFRGYVYISLSHIQLDLSTSNSFLFSLCSISGHGETSWCFSQVKGALNDDITDADVISCVEFNHDGDLLATGDKGGRVVIFQVSRHVITVISVTYAIHRFAILERSKFKDFKPASR